MEAEDWGLIDPVGPADVGGVSPLTLTECEADTGAAQDPMLGQSPRGAAPKVPVSAFLNLAKQQVGFREGRNNDNPYGRWYGMNNQPYCAMGLSWVAAQVGAAQLIGGRWAYCPYWAAWFRSNGLWSTTPTVGDIVFFDWSGERRPGREAHVGVVVKAGPSTIETVEFNTVPGSGNQSDGGGVFVRSRALSTTVGFGRPRWAPEAAVRPLPVSGHPVLVVDGVWGVRTTARLRQVLGVPGSGGLDATTIRALAVWLRQRPATTLTPTVVSALQSRVGVARDGRIGPVTVRALQRYLNRI